MWLRIAFHVVDEPDPRSVLAASDALTDADRDVTPSTARTPVDWVLAHGLLEAVDPQNTLVIVIGDHGESLGAHTSQAVLEGWGTIGAEALGFAGPDVDAEQILMCQRLWDDLIREGGHRQGAGVVLLQTPPRADPRDVLLEHRPGAVRQHAEGRPVLRGQVQQGSDGRTRRAAVGRHDEGLPGRDVAQRAGHRHRRSPRHPRLAPGTCAGPIAGRVHLGGKRPGPDRGGHARRA